MPWKKGQSGNPSGGGRKKRIFSIKDAFEREVKRHGQDAAIVWLREHHSDKYADLIVRYATEEIKRDMGTAQSPMLAIIAGDMPESVRQILDQRRQQRMQAVQGRVIEQPQQQADTVAGECVPAIAGLDNDKKQGGGRGAGGHIYNIQAQGDRHDQARGHDAAQAGPAGGSMAGNSEPQCTGSPAGAGDPDQAGRHMCLPLRTEPPAGCRQTR